MLPCGFAPDFRLNSRCQGSRANQWTGGPLQGGSSVPQSSGCWGSSLEPAGPVMGGSHVSPGRRRGLPVVGGRAWGVLREGAHRARAGHSRHTARSSGKPAPVNPCAGHTEALGGGQDTLRVCMPHPALARLDLVTLTGEVPCANASSLQASPHSTQRYRLTGAWPPTTFFPLRAAEPAL